MSLAALILYDHLLTLKREIRLYWRRDWNGATILFFCNKYLIMLLYLYGLSGFFPMSDSVRLYATSYTYRKCQYS